MNAEAHGDAHPVTLLQMCVECRHGSDNPQPGAHGPPGVIFVRLGIAEIDQQAIAEMLGNVAVEALDDLCAGGLIRPDHFPVVFGIELAGEADGIHQVAEHYRQLPPFGVGGARCDWCRGVLRRLAWRTLSQHRELSRGGEVRGRVRVAGPDQAAPRVVDHVGLRVQEFVLQGG